jgi:hypothetical protein
LLAAAREIVNSIPADAVLPDGAVAVVAECRAVLAGEDLDIVLSRFAAGWPAVVQCGPGWYRIVLDLDRRIAEVSPAARYAQIKEKFGGLRVYLDEHDAETKALSEHAEWIAVRTCEACGMPGMLRKDRAYVQTLCDYHAQGTEVCKRRPAQPRDWTHYVQPGPHAPVPGAPIFRCELAPGCARVGFRNCARE